MKYVYYLDNTNTVVNNIICENDVTSEFLDSTLTLEAFSNASSYVVLPEEEHKSYFGLGSTYDGVRLTPKRTTELEEWSFDREEWVTKPFASWVWDSEEEVWKAPTPEPTPQLGMEWAWDEESQSWIVFKEMGPAHTEDK